MVALGAGFLFALEGLRFAEFIDRGLAFEPGLTVLRAGRFTTRFFATFFRVIFRFAVFLAFLFAGRLTCLFAGFLRFAAVALESLLPRPPTCSAAYEGIEVKRNTKAMTEARYRIIRFSEPEGQSSLSSN